MTATEYVENLTEEKPEIKSFGTPLSDPRVGKKKGRKPKEELSDDAKAMDLVSAKTKEAELAITEIDKRCLPEGETYNLYVAIERAKFYQEQATLSFVELGKQIELLKAHEGHGRFTTVLEQLGMSWRAANYAMAASQKFTNSQTFANLGRSKQIALTVLDDDTIRALENGNEIPCIGTLDDVERMSVRELKAALRAEKQKRKEEREAQEAAISQKEQKLNELEMELRYREPPTKEQLAQAELDELKKKLFVQIGEASHAMHCLMQTIEAAQKIPNVNITQLQGFIDIEPDGFLSSIFDYADTLDEMIENIRPDKPDETDSFDIAEIEEE